jgi:CRP-like cAMP-binding protein
MPAIRPLDATPGMPAPAPVRSAPVRPVRPVAARATLFRQGDRADHLYEVAAGVAGLTLMLECGRRQVVSFVHPGDWVGFPVGGRHRADCEALTGLAVIAHRRAALEGPEGDPALRRRMQDAALREIVQLQDHLLLLARKGASGKLASFLCGLADRHGRRAPGGVALDLEVPRRDIADYLCISVETVSRTLTRMCADGLIRRDGPTRLVVADRAGLAAMAGAG